MFDLLPSERLQEALQLGSQEEVASLIATLGGLINVAREVGIERAAELMQMSPKADPLKECGYVQKAIHDGLGKSDRLMAIRILADRLQDLLEGT